MSKINHLYSGESVYLSIKVNNTEGESSVRGISPSNVYGDIEIEKVIVLVVFLYLT